MRSGSATRPWNCCQTICPIFFKHDPDLFESWSDALHAAAVLDALRGRLDLPM